MEAVIGLVISLLGAYLYDMDFCTLFTFISLALEIQKSLIKNTNDETAKR